MLKLIWVVENLFKINFEMVLSDFEQMEYKLIHESIHTVEKLLNLFMN